MKPHPIRKKGFTLIELTVVIVFGIALSSAGMLLLQQQIRTVRRLDVQEFILREAPKINSTLSSLLGQADAIRLHTSFQDAVNDTNPVLSNGTVLVAAYRNIDNSTSFGIISFDTNSNGVNALNYYILDRTSGATTLTQGSPSWTISGSDLNGASFNLVQGLFQFTLIGPSNEQITYTISPNQ